MIEIIELFKQKIPEGFSIDYPEKVTDFKQIRYKDWPNYLQYQFLECREYIGVEIHLESEKLKPLIDILRPYVDVIKGLEPFKQANDPYWDSLWYINQKSGGAGRLVIPFPKNTFPSVIVDAMLDLIELTFNDINDNLPDNESVDSNNTKDKTKYKFNDHIYNKRRLVLAVVSKYIDDNPDINYQKLEEAFSKELKMNSFGVFMTKEKAKSYRHRFFLEPEDILKTSDEEIAVCNQWGKGNIEKFVDHARTLGYQIEEVLSPTIPINNTTVESPELKIKEKEKQNMPVSSLPPLNVILYGPPGTGKTYNSINYAVSIIEEKPLTALEEESQTNRAEVERRFNEYREEGRVEFITFHQSYSYEDFIQGLKPDTDGEGQLSFNRKDGLFKIIAERAMKGGNFDDIYEKFKDDIDGMPNSVLNLKTKTHSKDFSIRVNSRGSCTIVPSTQKATEMTLTKRVIKEYLVNGKKLDWPSYLVPVCEYIKEKYNPVMSDANNKSKNFVIIIDEINRANISRVFGELITLIEPDKRETLKVTLPSGEIFSVPKNLYIVGTMNTADKSIALLDIALRRRFKFIGKYPDYSMIPIFKEYIKPINEEIKKRKKSSDFMIGHSYFMNKNKSDFADIFNSEIVPLLNEYFNNKTEVVEEILKAGKIEYIIDEDTFQIVVKEQV